MTKPRAWLATGLLLALPLAACGDPAPDPAPTPPPSSTSSAPATTTFTPPGDVPRVADPLDGTAFEQDPCTSLTAAQVTELKLGAGEKGSGDNPEQADDNCTYADLDPATELLVYVNFYPDNDTGLTRRYQQHWDGSWPRWEPGAVDEYPAVSFAFNPDDPTDCNVDVALSNTTVFNVKVFYYLWKGYKGGDTCGNARTIASKVLATIKNSN